MARLLRYIAILVLFLLFPVINIVVWHHTSSVCVTPVFPLPNITTISPRVEAERPDCEQPKVNVVCNATAVIPCPEPRCEPCPSPDCAADCITETPAASDVRSLRFERWKQDIHSHTQRQVLERARSQSMTQAATKPRTSCLPKLNNHTFRFDIERRNRHLKEWAQEAEAFYRERPQFLHSCEGKTVLCIMGVLHIYDGFKGPMGDLVQWSDLISALSFLGYSVTVVNSSKAVKPADMSKYWRVVSDYLGMLGTNIDAFRDKLFVIDTFGTSIQGNIVESQLYGGRNLTDLRRILTLVPDAHPLNTFLGTVSPPSDATRAMTMEWKALIWGKLAAYFRLPGVQDYLSQITQKLPVFASAESGTDFPPQVGNKGVMRQKDYIELLSQTAVFVGVGQPYIGTAAFDAVRQGSVLLNPMFDPPLNFWPGKPTDWPLTSQHPWVERIGAPCVQNVRINDRKSVAMALEEARDYHDFVKVHGPHPCALVPEASMGAFVCRAFAAFNELWDWQCLHPVARHWNL
ncbi:Alpha-1,6-mannosylglycoprotein 6-beta-N-acetylglucosaminyltransferase A [Pelomyxa schiedti]|nr:Alpha-1,6-mannosylglycoprotein 6-beta-N-acetylglucosaminyltransferase A [Pelomyxa schiedti]